MTNSQDGISSRSNLTKAEPMNPAPPVTNNLRMFASGKARQNEFSLAEIPGIVCAVEARLNSNVLDGACQLQRVDSGCIAKPARLRPSTGSSDEP